MSTNVGKKNIAHKGSGHGVVGPPAMSLVSPPAPPAPTPFVYSAQASNAKKTKKKFIIGGKEVMVKGSTMSLDPPANQPSQPTGGDVVTHATKNVAVMTMGSASLVVTGKDVCATGDMAALNVITDQSSVAQVQMPLLEAGDFEAAKAAAAAAAAELVKKWRAFPPSKSNQCRGGHPVDLGTGYVVDDAVDLELPGFVPLVWSRAYSSADPSRRGALGKGGWVHNFEQWLSPSDSGLRLYDEEGLPVDFAQPGPDNASFHRGKRLELRVVGAAVEITDLKTRFTRVFSGRADGRMVLRAIRDSRGHAISLTYDNDALVTVEDSVGRELRITNDEQGRVRRVEVWAKTPGTDEAPSCRTWFEYGYHPEGELASHTNALAHAEGWEYDGLHRMVRATLRNGVSFYYQYHPELGYCSRTWGDGGLHDLHIELDLANGETRTTQTARARRYQWKNGIVHREETFDGKWSIEREYDEDELLVAMRDGAGLGPSWKFDARGNPVEGIDPAGNSTRWIYDGTRMARRVDPTGLEHRHEFDPHGSLVRLTFPSGVAYDFDLDREGRLAAVHGPEGCRVRFQYDEQSNLIAETSARGGTTAYRYDALGNVVEEVDALGRVSRAQYDVMGRLVQVDRADGTTVRASYDKLGNTRTLTDALGATTHLEHSGTGRLAKLTRADGQAYQFLYDTDERLVEVINPRSERYHYEYDSADQLTAERTYDGRLVSYRYDAAGHLARADSGEGGWREYSYDEHGYVLTDRGEDVAITYSRDKLGRVERAVCQDVTGKVVTAFERDRYGRVTADIQNGRAVRYEYDDRGYRVARVLPGGQRTEYAFAEDGAFAGATHDGARLSISHDKLGRERARALGDWKQESEYDLMDRLVTQRFLAGAVPRELEVRRYGYDAKGRLTSVDSDVSGVSQYRYDRIDQVLEASTRGLREIFEYDPNGSLARLVEEVEGGGAGAGTFRTRKGNRLVAADKSRFVYDGAGRCIQRVEADKGATTYGWDSKNRLREVVSPDGGRVRFSYDALGRRVRKDVLGPASELRAPERRSVEFLWDGFALAEEIESRGSEVRSRVHVHEPGTFLPILQAEGDKTYAVVTDYVGTPKELVDEKGRVVWRARHGLYGNVVSVERAEDGVESPFRLLGQYADAETGLAHTTFRYFDPETGRWLSPDPLGLLGGPNHYAFDKAPTVGVDPLGLSSGHPILATQPAYMPPGDVMVAMAKPSTRATLIPPADRYVNPGHHDPNGGILRYNPQKSVLPSNHVDLFNRSIPVHDETSGKVVRWTREVRGKEVIYHRFDGDSGVYHWNGSTAGKTLAGVPRELAMDLVPKCVKG
ncbi:MAG: DUF6531 domain-containing protein [Polyangiaceae bacterium]